MAQHVGLEFLDYEMKVIKATKCNLASVLNFLGSKPESRQPCPLLWSVDEYDDTIFNSRQVELLLEEVAKLLDIDLPSDIKDSLGEITSVLSENVEYQYIRLVGD